MVIIPPLAILLRCPEPARYHLQDGESKGPSRCLLSLAHASPCSPCCATSMPVPTSYQVRIDPFGWVSPESHVHTGCPPLQCKFMLSLARNSRHGTAFNRISCRDTSMAARTAVVDVKKGSLLKQAREPDCRATDCQTPPERAHDR